MYKLGILGTARIAPKAVVTPSALIDNIHIYGIASRNATNAQQFATDNRIPHVYGSYQQMVDDPNIDIIYIPLPNAMHTEWCQKAMQQGKHVLCEKPLCMNAEEATRLQQAISAYSCQLMEGFHYRYHPVFQAVQQIMQAGEVGDILALESVFTVPPRPEGDIRFQYEMGGGSLMDLGCYCVHILRHLMGEEPEILSAKAMSPDGLIDWSMETEMAFGNSVQARVHCSFEKHVKYRSDVKVVGTEGTLHIPNPFSPQKNEGGTEILLEKGNKTEKRRVQGLTTFYYQLIALLKAIEHPFYLIPTGIEDATLNMKAIDSIYVAADLPPRRA
ncbi:MAG: Gfo/Idh/MocA family oxidoreductase [Bacteroidota bacterium]